MKVIQENERTMLDTLWMVFVPTVCIGISMILVYKNMNAKKLKCNEDEFDDVNEEETEETTEQDQ